jgi:ABC-type dipeptide/oligopeptide/nickel transport system ATPase component
MSASILIQPMTKEEMIAAAKQRWQRMGMVRSAPMVKINPPMPIVQEIRKPILVKPSRPIHTNRTSPEMYYYTLPTRRSSMAEILRMVCEDYDLTEAEIMAHRRHKKPCTARQIAMYLAKKTCHHSYPAIGRFFGRDHTTVLHAINITEKRIDNDHTFQRHVYALRSRLAHSPLTHLYWGA